MTLIHASRENADVERERAPRDLPVEERVRMVAAVARKYAGAIDEQARFPEEAFAAIREQRLLSPMVPTEYGGEGSSMSEIANVCYALGRACASTGMIYAMHQTKLACIVRHGGGSHWHQGLLRDVCEKQMLLASSTTEGQGGGNVRSSAAAVMRTGEAISLERAATVISYGMEADGLVTTARRAAEAVDSDQVLVVFLKQDYTLKKTHGWNTMGMRGTCSSGFMLRAKASAAQVLPEPYEKIHARTMLPTAHLLWGSVWTGIAADAVERARMFLRNAARNSDGRLPPGAAHFTSVASSLKSLRALLSTSLRRFERYDAGDPASGSIELQNAMNLLKVEASERSVAICLGALRACGLSGYRNDGEFSVSRNLRDALSSPIMINNDRILANVATATLLDGTPATLFD